MEILIGFLVFVVVVGFILWAVKEAPFLDEQWKGIARWALLVLAVILLLVWLFGHGNLQRIDSPFK